MTTPPILRKPKLHFDTEENSSHVTFDDGKDRRRNIPWLHYVEANWDYDEPDVIRLKIGEWLVVLRGNNLAPLYLAIEKRTLARVRAQPDLAAGGHGLGRLLRRHKLHSPGLRRKEEACGSVY